MIGEAKEPGCLRSQGKYPKDKGELPTNRSYPPHPSQPRPINGPNQPRHKYHHPHEKQQQNTQNHLPCQPLRILPTATRSPPPTIRRSPRITRTRGLGTLRTQQPRIDPRARMGVPNRTSRHPGRGRFRRHIRNPQRNPTRRRRHGRARSRHRIKQTNIPLPRRPPKSHRVRRVPPQPHDLHRPTSKKLGKLLLHHLPRHHKPQQSPSPMGKIRNPLSLTGGD